MNNRFHLLTRNNIVDYDRGIDDAVLDNVTGSAAGTFKNSSLTCENVCEDAGLSRKVITKSSNSTKLRQPAAKSGKTFMPDLPSRPRMVPTMRGLPEA